MRLISNEELVFVGGGAEVSGGVQQVVVTGTRLSWWETVFDYISDFFSGSGGGNGLSISDYNALQRAYANANASGSPVTTELSSGTVELKVGYKGAEASAKIGGTTKHLVTVKPAGSDLP